MYKANDILPANRTISGEREKLSFRLNSLTFYKQSASKTQHFRELPSLMSKSIINNRQKDKDGESIL